LPSHGANASGFKTGRHGASALEAASPAGCAEQVYASFPSFWEPGIAWKQLKAAVIHVREPTRGIAGALSHPWSGPAGTIGAKIFRISVFGWKEES
jgi:hypothetical protein